MVGMNKEVNYKLIYKSLVPHCMIHLTSKTMGVHERSRLTYTQLPGFNRVSFVGASVRLAVCGLDRSPTSAEVEGGGDSDGYVRSVIEIGRC